MLVPDSISAQLTTLSSVLGPEDQDSKWMSCIVGIVSKEIGAALVGNSIIRK